MPYQEPFDLACRLRSRPGFVFLDSTGPDLETGRFSFIGIDPFAEFMIQNGRAFWSGATLGGDPLAQFRVCLARYDLAAEPCEVPFRAGCIGHISYDLGRLLERLDPATPALPACSDMRFGFYDLVFAFDRRDRRAWICSSGQSVEDPHPCADLAKRRLAEAARHMQAVADHPAPNPPVTEWRSNFTAEGFARAVERVRDDIADGQIYQANLTQCFEADLPPGFDPWAFYAGLRMHNPAPFSAYMRDGDVTYASSSPERFLSLRGGLVEARPIKGTAKSAKDPVEDRAQGQALLASEKDRAENTMIVDLLRNDLSRVCAPGSVEVPVLCGLETYASVHHLTSVVQGRLQAGLGAVDVLKATFPGGSITGAPKIRAMDILTELEGRARGLYCGAMGYIGFDGAMDLNIAIRTAVIGQARARVQAGGGITLLSDPAAEYAESVIKAERLLAAFGADMT